MKKLFEGPVTVIELGDSLAAAYCGRLFVQLGATVIKVEPLAGSPLRLTAPFLDSPADRVSATFTALNTGKQTFGADIETPEGRAAIEELLRVTGDVVLMSGTMAQWEAVDFTPTRILDLVPTAVVGRVTTFGDCGPYADLIGGELQAQALGGLMNMVGLPTREPLRMGGYQAQYSTGLALLAGFSLGMWRRVMTGAGGKFTTSVIETVAHIEWKGALSFEADGSVATRSSLGAPAILRTRDGFFAFFYRPDDWSKVVAIMPDPRLKAEKFATQQGRDLNRLALLEVLNDCTSRMSKRELYHLTQAGRMTTGYMATMGDLLQSEQYLARGFFEKVDLGDLGVGLLPGAPWRVVGGCDVE